MKECAAWGCRRMPLQLQWRHWFAEVTRSSVKEIGFLYPSDYTFFVPVL